jgi:hypothetical protein
MLFTHRAIIVKTALLSSIKNNFVVFGFLLLTVASEAQITSWTFDPFNGTNTNPAPNVGVGTASIVNLGGGTITPGARTGMTGIGCGAQTTGNAWAYEPFDPGTVNESNFHLGSKMVQYCGEYRQITIHNRWSNLDTFHHDRYKYYFL